MLALTFFFVGVMASAAVASMAQLPSQEAPLVVDPKGKEVKVYAVIYPHRFNTAGGEEAHYHLLVWSGGTTKGALLETPADDLAFYEALVGIGGKPADNLAMSTWTQRYDSHSSAPRQRVEGSPLALWLSWESNKTGVPIHQAFHHKDAPDLSWRFGGNRQRWFNLVPFARRPGCLACLYSCPSGKVSNHAFTVHDYIDKPARFVANLAVLPPDGTPVVVTFRLAP